jgi:hypothetical protein
MDMCGAGGLICLNCKAMGMGCSAGGCGTVSCTGCTGCCDPTGTCQTTGMTDDQACGANGAACIDCTAQNPNWACINGNCQ